MTWTVKDADWKFWLAAKTLAPIDLKFFVSALKKTHSLLSFLQSFLCLLRTLSNPFSSLSHDSVSLSLLVLRHRHWLREVELQRQHLQERRRHAACEPSCGCDTARAEEQRKRRGPRSTEAAFMLLRRHHDGQAEAASRGLSGSGAWVKLRLWRASCGNICARVGRQTRRKLCCTIGQAERQMRRDLRGPVGQAERLRPSTNRGVAKATQTVGLYFLFFILETAMFCVSFRFLYGNTQQWLLQYLCNINNNIIYSIGSNE